MRHVFTVLLIFAMAAVVHGATLNVPGDYSTIQAAISAANSGDTILVAAGTYTETGQIVINKNLTIIGAGADETIIKPAGNTGSDGDARGWFLVTSGKSFTLRGVTLDGAGKFVHTAIRSWGSLNIEDCTIKNIAYTPSSYDGRAIGPYAGSNTIRRVKFSNIYRIGVLVFGTGTTATIEGCTYTGKGSGNWLDYAVEAGGGGFAKVTNCVITDCKGVASVDGSTSAGVLGTTFYGSGTQVLVTCTKFRRCTAAVAIGYDGGDTTSATIRFCDLAGNDCGVSNVSSVTVTATKNWWGGEPITEGAVDTSSPLLTSAIHLAAAGSRLVETQNSDGGWGWPLSGSSAANTIGPIGMGLCKAYEATGDPSMLTAIGKVATFLQSKTNTFSTADGYLAAELDKVLGGNANVNYVKTNFYDKLALGTYYRSDGSGPYNTASYVNFIRTSRASQGIPNLAAWDLGMGLVGAVRCGASTSEWIAGVQAEITEIDYSKDYDVIGLAGALYGLKTAGVSFAPSLAATLASFQIAQSGGFTWNSNYVIPFDWDECIQETAYAALALDAIGGYGGTVASALEYINSNQLDTGGWKQWIGSASENNEITAEGSWAIALQNNNQLYLDVAPESLYVRPGETVNVTLKQKNLTEPIAGYQAWLVFETDKLSFSSGTYTSSPYGLPVISSIAADGGNIDLAAGIAPSQSPTTADADLVNLTFVAGNTNGATAVSFRTHDPATMLTNYAGDKIIPGLTDSQTIVIDGIAPSVTVTSPNGGEYLKGGGSWTITWTASDANLDPNSIKIEYWNGSSWVTIASGEANDGSYTWNPVPSLDINTAKVRVTATDLAGNSASDESDSAFTIDSTKPTVTNIKLTADANGSGTDLTPNGTAIQGTYYVSVYVSDNLAGVNYTVMPTITVKDANGNSLVTGSVTADEPNGRFYVPITVTAASANGTANINVSGVTDKSGNVADPAADTFNINKTTLTVTIHLESVTVASVQRYIKLVLGGDQSSGVKQTYTPLVTFNGGTGTVTFTNVPNANWTKISAKDEQHTLRRTVSVTDPSGNKQYVANFTGDNQLLGGDVNNDQMVDIRDFGIYAGQYGTSPALNTQWPIRNANISCDGYVDTNDFTYIQINFLKVSNPDVGYAIADAQIPISSITVNDLAKQIGVVAAKKADLNYDGVVDQKDMALFAKKMK